MTPLTLNLDINVRVEVYKIKYPGAVVMLKRIYIDNFCSLVNFELSFESINLFIGDNGTGKSTVFDVLRRIQNFVLGFFKVEGAFPGFTCTRWQNISTQQFKLSISGNGGDYTYELCIGHNLQQSHIKYERIKFNEQLLLSFNMGEAQVFNDNYLLTFTYPFDWSQSILPFLQLRDDSKKLAWFRKSMERFINVKIFPSQMSGLSQEKNSFLSHGMENYCSWYFSISQDQRKVTELTSRLQRILDGFVGFKFDQIDHRNTLLTARFLDKEDKNRIIDYGLHELSDGQKVLIALYSIIYCTKSEDYILCIDEPENFLGLREIQPWLVDLYDFCTEGKIQALLISHHPEFINYGVISTNCYLFERESNAPSSVRKISNSESEETGLPISELIARGWLNESA